MDETDWVERYAYFGAMRDLQGVNEANALMDEKGDITHLGLQYIGAEGPDTSGEGRTITRDDLCTVLVALGCALSLVWKVL